MNMNTKEQVISEIENLSDSGVQEALDFIRFLRHTQDLENNSFSRLAESALNEEWLSNEEDEAWKEL